VNLPLKEVAVKLVPLVRFPINPVLASVSLAALVTELLMPLRAPSARLVPSLLVLVPAKLVPLVPFLVVVRRNVLLVLVVSTRLLVVSLPAFFLCVLLVLLVLSLLVRVVSASLVLLVNTLVLVLVSVLLVAPEVKTMPRRTDVLCVCLDHSLLRVVVDASFVLPEHSLRLLVLFDAKPAVVVVKLLLTELTVRSVLRVNSRLIMVSVRLAILWVSPIRRVLVNVNLVVLAPNLTASLTPVRLVLPVTSPPILACALLVLLAVSL